MKVFCYYHDALAGIDKLGRSVKETDIVKMTVQPEMNEGKKGSRLTLHLKCGHDVIVSGVSVA